jgi:hypothetical protein
MTAKPLREDDGPAGCTLRRRRGRDAVSLRVEFRYGASSSGIKTPLIPGSRLFILLAGRDFQISIAPNRVLSGFRFEVPISTSAAGDLQKTTPKIVSLVEASTTTEEEAHETS